MFKMPSILFLNCYEIQYFEKFCIYSNLCKISDIKLQELKVVEYIIEENLS